MSRQRDVHDRDVEQQHEDAGADGDEGPPLRVASPRRCAGPAVLLGHGLVLPGVAHVAMMLTPGTNVSPGRTHPGAGLGDRLVLLGRELLVAAPRARCSWRRCAPRCARGSSSAPRRPRGRRAAPGSRTGGRPCRRTRRSARPRGGAARRRPRRAAPRPRGAGRAGRRAGRSRRSAAGVRRTATAARPTATTATTRARAESSPGRSMAGTLRRTDPLVAVHRRGERMRAWISRPLALAFGAIFVVELPDKTFLATLVLADALPAAAGVAGRRAGVRGADRHRRRPSARRRRCCRPRSVQGAAVVLFLVGAVLLVREGRSQQEAASGDGSSRRRRRPPGGAPCWRRSWCCSRPSGATCRSC